MSFLPLIESLSPSFVDEIHGLADGAGISLDEAVLCQTRVEASGVAECGCTAFAVTGDATLDHDPLAGQNQDLSPEFADVAILLRVNPSDARPAALMFTFAGQLGYVGMNCWGLAHFHNALYDYEWSLGVPRYAMERVLLEQGSVEECVSLLQQHRMASARNLLVCDSKGKIADIEVRPEGSAIFEDEHPDYCVHSNHYLTSEFAAYETHSLSDSCRRRSRMQSLIKQNWGKITVETMKRILADHDNDPSGICRHGGTGLHSVSGYIAETAKGLFHVRRGHGCLGTWHTYQL